MAIISAVPFLLALIIGMHADNVDIKEKLKADIANIQDQIKNMEGNTEDLQKNLDEFSTGLNDYIKEEDTETALKAKIDKAKAVVDGTTKAIPKFKSGDPAQIISGVLDMTSVALATFGGPHGAAAALVLNVVSSLISLFQTSPKSSPAIDKVMKEVLDDFKDEELLRKMNSFIATFDTVHYGIVATRGYSNDIEGKDLSENDITSLKTEVKSFEANTLLEDVKQSIANEIESGKVDDANKALKTLNVYCKLTTVIELVVFEFVAYIKEEGEGTSVLPTYYHKFIERKRARDVTYLEFLHYPKPKEAITAAIYQHNPEAYPALREYVTAIKVAPIPNLNLKDGDEIYLTPKKFPKWYSYLSSEGHSRIYGSKSTNDQNKFILKKAYTGEGGNEWKMENKYYPNYVITARKFEGCMPLRHPDEVSYVEGLTMSYITSVRRNCKSNCYANRKCSGCYSNCLSYFKVGRLRGLVSLNYVWRFTKLKTESRCPYYLISATQEQFNPGYALFMKDSTNANSYLKYGNPGESGMWKLTKRSC